MKPLPFCLEHVRHKVLLPSSSHEMIGPVYVMRTNQHPGEVFPHSAQESGLSHGGSPARREFWTMQLRRSMLPFIYFGQKYPPA